jgi:hypothetical protein
LQSQQIESQTTDSNDTACIANLVFWFSNYSLFESNNLHSLDHAMITCTNQTKVRGRQSSIRNRKSTERQCNGLKEKDKTVHETLIRKLKNHIKTRRWTRVLLKNTQFLLHWWHISCYVKIRWHAMDEKTRTGIWLHKQNIFVVIFDTEIP